MESFFEDKAFLSGSLLVPTRKVSPAFRTSMKNNSNLHLGSVCFAGKIQHIKPLHDSHFHCHRHN